MRAVVRSCRVPDVNLCVAWLSVAQGDLVGLGDVVGLDGPESHAHALASLPQQREGVGGGALRGDALRISPVFLDEMGLKGGSDFVGCLQRVVVARSRAVSSTMGPVSRLCAPQDSWEITRQAPSRYPARIIGAGSRLPTVTRELPGVPAAVGGQHFSALLLTGTLRPTGRSVPQLATSM